MIGVIASGTFAVTGSRGPVDVRDWDNVTLLAWGLSGSATLSVVSIVEGAFTAPVRSVDNTVITDVAVPYERELAGIHQALTVSATISGGDPVSWVLVGVRN